MSLAQQSVPSGSVGHSPATGNYPLQTGTAQLSPAFLAHLAVPCQQLPSTPRLQPLNSASGCAPLHCPASDCPAWAAAVHPQPYLAPAQLPAPAYHTWRA